MEKYSSYVGFVHTNIKQLCAGGFIFACNWWIVVA
jgi:hypothetical protein